MFKVLYGSRSSVTLTGAERNQYPGLRGSDNAIKLEFDENGFAELYGVEVATAFDVVVSDAQWLPHVHPYLREYLAVTYGDSGRTFSKGIFAWLSLGGRLPVTVPGISVVGLTVKGDVLEGEDVIIVDPETYQVWHATASDDLTGRSTLVHPRALNTTKFTADDWKLVAWVAHLN